MRILFYATWPTQTNGYARVANILTNCLAEDEENEVYYFGISNFKDTRGAASRRFIHPKIKLIDVLEEEKKIGSSEIYGVDIIEEWMNKIKPDVFFIYNDLIVCCRLFNALLDYRKKYSPSTTRFVTYIDLVYPFERIEYIEHLDRNSDTIIAFSECWKTNLVEMGVSPQKIKILHHGLENPKDTIPAEITKSQARQAFGIAEDDFVILNTNRNSYRKAIDLTISSFIHFLKSKNFDSRIKLFLNCFLNSSSGYDIVSTIKTECVKEKVSFEKDVQSHILVDKETPGFISDERIRLLYLSCDVGVNTCVGEGFGLCNVEHAAFGRPQIVSKVGALNDIFGGDEVFFSKAINPAHTIVASNQLDGHNGYISFCRKEDFANAFSFYYDNPSKIEEDGKLVKEYIIAKFSWDKIIKEEFKPLFSSL